ncbi:MAG: flagellar hook-associated protein FlgK [Lachnospiraceae bacterium]|jgi:flagellar hook-associated protein 1 FlgK|nr:flagellar hook-associated protein FlgK [Lachnospiraceae bacterium]
MPSQFFGLYIASSGLRAANAALNTTSNNIANAQTVGYSRQQVVQEASDALRTFTTYGCAGAGVDTIAIERVRDHFYDVKYWNNRSSLGECEVQQYYMQTMEDYFKDDGMSDFKTLFDEMSNALQSVTTNSSSTSFKKDFISSVSAMTEYFNNMYGNLQEMQNDLNLEIKQTVDEINSIGEKLSILNRQINTIELSGVPANELRDQREALVDELSLLVDVKVEETPIYDANDPTRLTGGTNYTVSIAGGQILASGNEYNQLICTARQSYEKVNQTDVDGLFDVKWDNGNNFNMNNGAMDGKLKGLFEMRDGNNSVYFNGRVKEIGTTSLPNGVLTSTVTVAVTDTDLMDMKLCGLSDTGGTLNIGGQVYYYSDWEYDATEQQYTFTLDNTRCEDIINQSKIGQEAENGSDVDYQGVPYYMTQMNAWLRGFAEKVNDIFTSGYDTKGQAGSIFFTGEKVDGSQFQAGDLDATAGNGLYEITAGNVTVFAELVSNADRLGSKSTADVGVEECEQIKEMIDMLVSKEKFNFRNGTAVDFLELILGDVALNAGNANTFQKTYAGLDTAINNQRGSISGVDEDEEAVNLVKYQNSYTLASKMIQTMSEIYDRLILQTGV